MIVISKITDTFGYIYILRVMNKQRKYPIHFPCKEMPKDVHDILIRRQAIEKVKCGCIVSLETTLYKIIRESENKDK